MMLTSKKRKKKKYKNLKRLGALALGGAIASPAGKKVIGKASKKVYNKLANTYYRTTKKSRPYNPKLEVTAVDLATDLPITARINTKGRQQAASELFEKNKAPTNRNINSYIVEQRRKNLKTLGSGSISNGRTPAELEVIKRKKRGIAQSNAKKAKELRAKGAYYKINSIPLAEFNMIRNKFQKSKQKEKRPPTLSGHIAKGAGYGAGLAALGGALKYGGRNYKYARSLGAPRLASAANGGITGALAGAYKLQSGLLPGIAAGAGVYGAKKMLSSSKNKASKKAKKR